MFSDFFKTTLYTRSSNVKKSLIPGRINQTLFKVVEDLSQVMDSLTQSVEALSESLEEAQDSLDEAQEDSLKVGAVQETLTDAGDLILYIKVSGFSKEEIKVVVDTPNLEIRVICTRDKTEQGLKSSNKVTVHRTVPQGFDLSKVFCTLKDEVLKICIPKQGGTHDSENISVDIRV